MGFGNSRAVKILLRQAGLVLVALAFAPLAARAADEPVTFNNQVVRILQQHCQTCHRPDNIAPFSLLTYEDAVTHAYSMRYQVEGKAMPPWKPVDESGKFLGERRLTQQEIQTLVRWVDAGMLEGETADLPPPLKFPQEWTYNTPDVVVQPAAPYELSPTGGEIYRCFSMPVNSTADLNVRGYEVLPGNREIVHHVLLFIDTSGVSATLDADDPAPGYTCFGGPGFIPSSALGGWVPGMTPEIFPLGLGVRVPGNSRIVMQVHYSPEGHVGHTHGTGKLEPDSTRVGMFLAPERVRQVEYLPVVNPFFTIPAGNTRYEVSASLPIPTTLELTAVTPHMHLLGREVLVEARLPNGSVKQLVHITDWDFNWQATYTFRQPILLPAGTIVTSRAWYDNSSGNPRNPSSPPVAVRWGERTVDEMCLTFLSVAAPGSRPMTQVPFTIGDRGGMTVNGTEEGNTTAGYARLTPGPDNPSPDGLAIFGFRQNGVLVTETAVQAALPLDRGRLFAEAGPGVRSGIALANSTSEDVSVTYSFVDSGGVTIRTGSTNIPAKTQIARYLTETPFSGPSLFAGSFSFSASRPIAVVALRETVNERGESLLTTLPVAPLLASSAPSVSSPLVFPHYADGAGWRTQLLLVNPTGSAIQGVYRFYGADGVSVGSDVPYAIAPNSALKYETPGTSQALSGGSLYVVPSAGMAAPTGSLVFSFRNNIARVTEAGLAPTAEAKAFRAYVESSADGLIQSGIAIANPTDAAVTAVLELSNLSGSSAARAVVSLPAHGQLAALLSQISGFESVRLPFQGLLRISSESRLSATGLRVRYNERSEVLIAATPAVPEGSASQGSEKIFAHFVSGGAFSTQFVVFSTADTPNGGTLSFYAGNGQPATVNVR